MCCVTILTPSTRLLLLELVKRVVAATTCLSHAVSCLGNPDTQRFITTTKIEHLIGVLRVARLLSSRPAAPMPPPEGTAATTSRTGTSGPSRPDAKRRRVLAERQQQGTPGVIDLTPDDDDDEVQIVKTVVVSSGPVGVGRRVRVRGPAGAAAAPLGAAAAAPAPFNAAPPPAPSPQPEQPKGFTCTICLERTESNLATTTCGHMSCYTCLSEWVKKSGTCPQCRGKVNKKTGIIRLFPPS